MRHKAARLVHRVLDMLCILGVDQPVSITAVVGCFALLPRLGASCSPADRTGRSGGCGAALHLSLGVDLHHLPQLVQAVVVQMGATAVAVQGVGAVAPAVVAIVGGFFVADALALALALAPSNAVVSPALYGF